MDHLENKSFEEPRWQYAGDGVGSCPLQSLPVRLTTEGPSGAAVSRVNCVTVVSYFPHTEHIQPFIPQRPGVSILPLPK